jgi:hypothetical protein
MSVTPRPTRTAVGLTAGFAIVAVLPLLVVPITVPAAAAGGTLSIVGTVVGSRRVLGVGVIALLAGSLLAGSQGLPVPLLAVATVGALLVWDVGEQSISVARQLGRASDVERPIFVHAAVSTVGSVAIAAGVSLVYTMASGGQPIETLVLLLVGGAFIVTSLNLS